MNVHAASQRIGVLAFLLLEAAQCMELTRAASSGRLVEISNASDRAGSVVASSEEAKMSKSSLNQETGRIRNHITDHSVKAEIYNLEGSVGDIDKRFQLRQDSLKNLQKSIFESIKTRGGDEAVGMYDELANEFQFSAGQLHSLRKDIFERSQIQAGKEHTDLVNRLQGIINHTPRFELPMHQSITATEDEALQVQARELDGMFFRTINFMHDKNLITHDALMTFLQKEPNSHRLTSHVMMDPKGLDNDLYAKIRKKGGLSYTLAPKHPSWPTSEDPFNKVLHPYYAIGSDGIKKDFHFSEALASREAVEIDTEFEGTRKELQKLLGQIQQYSNEGKPESYYDQLTKEFRKNAEELNSIHEKLLQSASNPHSKNADQLNNLQAILKETPLFTEVHKEIYGAETIKLKQDVKTLQALVFQTIDFMYQKQLIELDEFEGFFREGNTMQRLANHLMLIPGGDFNRGFQIPFKLGSSEKIQGLISGYLKGNFAEFIKLAMSKPK